MGLARLTIAVTVAVLALAACSDQGSPADLPDGGGGDDARAGGMLEPVAVGAFRATIEPRSGRLNVTRTDTPAIGVNLDFGGGRLGGEVTLFTDQTRVLYHGPDGVCHSNGNVVPCPASGPCAHQDTFCGPIQITSTFPGELPDVVIQLAHFNTITNRINGCQDDAQQSMGLCAATNPARVDSPSSNLISPIIGDPAQNLFGCSYCYGNATRAAQLNLPGLAGAVLPTTDPQVLDVQTDTVALRLENDHDFSVDIVVLAAWPAVDKPGAQLQIGDGLNTSCVTPGYSWFALRGGGFGVPAECMGPYPLHTCEPGSATAATDHSVTMLDKNSQKLELTPFWWSDDTLVAGVPPEVVDGPVTVNTPAGSITTDDELKVCTQQLSITPASGGPGRTVVLSGEGYRANEPVVLTFAGQPWTNANADASGSFTRTASVPANAATGTQFIIGRGGITGEAAYTTYLVAGSLAATPTDPFVHGQVQADVTGFGAGEHVLVSIGGIPCGDVVSDASGSAGVLMIVPDQPSGAATLTATGATTGTTRSTSVTLRRQVTASPTSGGPGRQIDVSAYGYGGAPPATFFFVQGGSSFGIQQFPASFDAQGTLHLTLAAPDAPNGPGQILTNTGMDDKVADFSIVGGLTVTPDPVGAGGSVTISGTGFAPSESVTWSFDNTTLFSFTDASGAFSETIGLSSAYTAGSPQTVPVSATGASGTHRETTCTVKPTLVLTPDLGAGPFGAVHVSGNGWAANKVVTLKFNGAAWGTATASAAGQLSVDLQVPDLPNGSYPVTATYLGFTSGLFFNVIGSFQLSPTVVLPGGSFTASGSGYLPGEGVGIHLGGFPGPTLDAVFADASGNFSVQIPASTLGYAGTYTLAAHGGNSGTLRSAFIDLYSTVVVTPDHAGSDQTVVISGAGYAPGETVSAAIQGGAALLTTTADGAGTFSKAVALPALASGHYFVIAVGNVTQQQHVADLDIAAQLTATPMNPQVTTSVSVTGNGFASGETVDCSVGGLVGGSMVATGTGTISGLVNVRKQPAVDQLLRCTGQTSGLAPTLLLDLRARIVVAPTAGGPNRLVTVTGDGFGANAEVDVLFNDVHWFFAATDAVGSFSKSANIPLLGNATDPVTGIDSVNGINASTSFTITGSITLTPSSGGGGTLVRVRGTAYGSVETVTIRFDGNIVKTGTTDTSGSFDLQFNLPSIVASGAHQVRATGSTTQTQRTATFTVP